jgi:hypothetical protein
MGLLLIGCAMLFSFGLLLTSRMVWQCLLLAAASAAGLLLERLQPTLERFSDVPWSLLFWPHVWMGQLLIALLLSSTTLQPLICHSVSARRIYISSNLPLAFQAISGTRKLQLVCGLSTHATQTKKPPLH